MSDLLAVDMVEDIQQNPHEISSLFLGIVDALYNSVEQFATRDHFQHDIIMRTILRKVKVLDDVRVPQLRENTDLDVEGVDVLLRQLGLMYYFHRELVLVLAVDA